LASHRVETTVGEGGCHDGHGFGGGENGADLEVKFESVIEALRAIVAEAWRPRFTLTHHEAKTPVPVRTATLGLVSLVIISNWCVLPS